MSGFNSIDRPASLLAPCLARGMRIIGALSTAILVLASSPALADGPFVVDTDGDGLIEIHTLEDLHSIRYDLAGTSLKRSREDPGNSNGCPRGQCGGYELMANLDFDGPDDDTTTWTRSADGSLTLDKDDHNSAWFDVEAGGWLPIGGCGDDGICVDWDDSTDETADNGTFTAVFDGNGHTISNLALSRALPAIGLFSAVGAGGDIRNIILANSLINSTAPMSEITLVGGLVAVQHDGSITNGSFSGEVGRAEMGEKKINRSKMGQNIIGGLVGRQLRGSIKACRAGADVRGNGAVGGLVGGQTGGAITRSEAASDIFVADGFSGTFAGGLIGFQLGGVISESHATGDVAGSSGSLESLGGLGGHGSGAIVASYAAGDVRSGGGGQDRVGGLVGVMQSGSVTASYATGDVAGGESDSVGGLVGVQVDTPITASYAKGDVRGDGSYHVGGLVGDQVAGPISASYATGDTRGGEETLEAVGGLVGIQLEGTVSACFATGDNGVYSLVGKGTAESVSASWGFGVQRKGEASQGMNGTDDLPAGVDAVSKLTFGSGDEATDAPPIWNSAASKTSGAWDFGTSKQAPALAYADYDGELKTYHCAADAGNAPEGAILIPNCASPATLIPGQRAEE